MKYTDNGIVFDNVKEIAKYANIDSNARYSAKDYDYDDNGNPTAPKFLINAIDIDWNGAKPNIGETSDGITTTGELLTLIKKYANTTVKNSLIGEDGNRWPTQKTLYGVKDYADGVQSASYNQAKIEASNVLGKDGDLWPTQHTVYGVAKYAEIQARLAYTDALNNAVEEAQVYTNTEIGRLEDNLIGASTDAVTANTIWGAKNYANTTVKNSLLGASGDAWTTKQTIYSVKDYADGVKTASYNQAKIEASNVLGTDGDLWATQKTVYGVANYADTTVKNSLIGESTDASTADTIWGAKRYADGVKTASYIKAQNSYSAACRYVDNQDEELRKTLLGDAPGYESDDSIYGVRNSLIGNSDDHQDTISIHGARNYAEYLKLGAVGEAKQYTDGELAKLQTRVEALEKAFSTLAQNVGTLVTITNGE